MRSGARADTKGQVRALLPRPADETRADEVYGDLVGKLGAAGDPPPGRPYVLVNMVSSVDGAISVDGLSGGLSSEADKSVFAYLRSIADVILVGAATAREENYGPPKVAAHRIEQRLARGQQRLPRIAVVSKSVNLDLSARLFTEIPAGETGPQRPYVICPADAPAAKVAAAEAVADVIAVGAGGVDDRQALTALADRGARLVLCEGGPSLNARLLADGLVDELCLTLSAVLVGGLGRRISGTDEPFAAIGLQLITAASADSMLLLRYAVVPANPASQD